VLPGQREYTRDEYYKLLDGLRYEEVVNYPRAAGIPARQQRFVWSTAVGKPMGRERKEAR